VNVTGIAQSGTTITASLALAYALAPSVSGSGSIWPAATTTVAFGGSMTFTITPDAGYHITDVLVDGYSVGVVSEYTFSNTQGDHEIQAVFANESGSALSNGGDSGGGGGGGGCFISSLHP
jgi:hypothetical protein